MPQPHPQGHAVTPVRILLGPGGPIRGAVCEKYRVEPLPCMKICLPNRQLHTWTCCSFPRSCPPSLWSCGQPWWRTTWSRQVSRHLCTRRTMCRCRGRGRCTLPHGFCNSHIGCRHCNPWDLKLYEITRGCQWAQKVKPDATWAEMVTTRRAPLDWAVREILG